MFFGKLIDGELQLAFAELNLFFGSNGLKVGVYAEDSRHDGCSEQDFAGDS